MLFPGGDSRQKYMDWRMLGIAWYEVAWYNGHSIIKG